MKINHKQPNSSWKAGRLLNDESGVYFECSSLSWTSRPGDSWQLPLMIAARTRGSFDPDCHVMWTVSVIRWILTQPWIYQRHFSFVAACVDMYTKLFWKLLYVLIFNRSCSHYIVQKQIQEGECSRSSLNGGGVTQHCQSLRAREELFIPPAEQIQRWHQSLTDGKGGVGTRHLN